MSTSRSSSRPATASSASSANDPTNALFVGPNGKSKFDIWNLIKRPITANPYHLTARYRMSNTPIRHCKSGTISRKRRKDSQITTSECEESNRSVTTATDIYDMEKDFLDDYDFDADEEADGKSPGQAVTHSQGVYLRACKKLKISPNSYVLRNLIHDVLLLKHHLLGPDGVKAIAIALIENSSVTSLDLEDNGLGLTGVRHIGEMLSENTFIVDINLAQNELKTEGTKYILERLKDTDVVQKLNLSANSLQEYDGDLFKEYIEETRNLRELRLNYNCFREVGGMALGECLGWNDTIEKLELCWNHLRSTGAKAIAHALTMNSAIKYLDVSWNGFYLEGSKEMAQALLKNSTLEYLDMSSNRINKQCLLELVKGLKGNSTLKVLRLCSNPITAQGAYFLLSQMLEMPNSGLEEIDLGYQSVEPNFLELLDQVKEARPNLEVHFGAVLGQDVESKDEEQELMDENPVVVLMEFGNIQGYRLIDLFAMMDKDNSKTLTRQEIKNGLLGCNIPLSEKALDNLVQKLDEDGDGEIDYGELIAGKQQHRRKLTKTIMMSREQKVDMEDTEVGRVRRKLKRLMNKRDEKLRPKSAMTILNAMTTLSGKPLVPKPDGANATNPLKPVDETDGEKKDHRPGNDIGKALTSVLPRPTEEGVDGLPNLLRQGSLFKDLLS